MKRFLGIAAVAGLLVAAPAFAAVDVFVQFGTPAPVYAARAPVYVAPAYVAPAAYYRDPRWYDRHDRFNHHYYRDHRWHRDYRR